MKLRLRYFTAKFKILAVQFITLTVGFLLLIYFLRYFISHLLIDNSEYLKSVELLSLYFIISANFVVISLVVITYILIYQTVFKPINRISLYAKEIAKGNIDAGFNYSNKDEFYPIVDSLNTISRRIREISVAANKIANGELSVDLKPASNKDILNKNMSEIANVLRDLVVESAMIEKAIENGNLNIRGKDEKYRGGYRKIIQWKNTILDGIDAPIKESIIVLDAVSEGDLSLKVMGNYKGDFSELKKVVNKSILSINSSISGLVEEIEKINMVSKNIEEISSEAVLKTDKFKDRGAIAPDNRHILNKINELYSSFEKRFFSLNKKIKLFALNTGIKTKNIENFAKNLPIQLKGLKEFAKESLKSIEEIEGNFKDIQNESLLAFDSIRNTLGNDFNHGEKSNQVLTVVQESSLNNNSINKNPEESLKESTFMAQTQPVTDTQENSCLELVKKINVSAAQLNELTVNLVRYLRKKYKLQ